MLVFISIIILLPEIQSQWPYYGNRNIQCYSCSDCPEPFFLYPAQVTLTPPDVGYCMKTVIYIENSGHRLISKGFSRNCVPERSSNVQVYCCNYDLCNRSNLLFSSVLVVFASFSIIILSSIL